jgi:2-succinyl-5-enolpyruvyl-6-hydroxy-3-cyclohexene-1-carboxylate synthase
VDRTNRNTALASALAEELERAGVGHVCISTGSRSAPLALAIWRQPGLQTWVLVAERCSGFFALGVARQTGQPVAVLTTSGTAAANLHPAVAEASESRTPIVVITADRPPELRGRGAGQTIDQLKLFGSAVRWFCEVGVHPASDDGLLHFRSVAVRAVAESLGSPPGPVHLNVPLTEPLAPDEVENDVSAESALALEGRPGRRPITKVARQANVPSGELVSEFAELITGCERGVILAGRGQDPGVAQAVTAVAGACGYPVLAEPISQLRAGKHSLESVVAHYDAIFRALPDGLEPELVVRVGDMVTSKAVRTWLTAHPECRQVVVDPDGAWNEPTARAELIARADPKLLFGWFAEELERRRERRWLDLWREADRLASEAIDSFLDGLGEEPFEPRVHRRLATLLPALSTVFVASSMPVRDLESFLPAIDRPVRFLANRGANGIDGVVSSALGAASVAPGPTFVLLGDLALYHDMNGLLAYGRLRAEATIVVLNNGGGGIFDFLPIARHRDGYEELFGTPTGLDLEKVAALYGLPFTRVASHGELDTALGGPGMVEVVLDRRRNVELHEQVFDHVKQRLQNIRPGSSNV